MKLHMAVMYSCVTTIPAGNTSILTVSIVVFNLTLAALILEKFYLLNLFAIQIQYTYVPTIFK